MRKEPFAALESCWDLLSKGSVASVSINVFQSKKLLDKFNNITQFHF